MDRIEAAHRTEQRHLHRSVTMHVDDEGMVIIRGRLTPEIGAVVQRALEAAADRLFKESAQAPTSDPVSDEVTPAQRRADALGRLAECALTADLDRGNAGDRYQVVLHVDAVADDVTRGTGASRPWPGSSHYRREPITAEAGHAVLELDDCATYVSAETWQRIACDGSRVVMRHAPDAAVLDVGRRTRTIPVAIRRALLARDRHCQFPSCTALRCDGHHIRHWADGGLTNLGNITLLCRRHHRAVHEGGFRIVQRVDGTPAFYRPDGTSVEIAPAMPRWDPKGADPLAPTAAHLTAAVDIDPYTATARGDGVPLDVGWVIDVLRQGDFTKPDGPDNRCEC